MLILEALGHRNRARSFGCGSAHVTSRLAGARQWWVGCPLSTRGDRRSLADLCGGVGNYEAAPGPQEKDAPAAGGDVLEHAARWRHQPRRSSPRSTGWSTCDRGHPFEPRRGTRPGRDGSAPDSGCKPSAERKAVQVGGKGSRARPSAPLPHRFAGPGPTSVGASRCGGGAGLHRAQGIARRAGKAGKGSTAASARSADMACGLPPRSGAFGGIAVVDRMATTSTARSLGARVRRVLGRGERHRGRGLRPREYGLRGRTRTSDRSSDTPARSLEPCPCT